MPDRIIPLIMCGGAGTRLWPLSRENRPKQFISLFGSRSMFQETMLRVADGRLFDRPIVVTGDAYRFIVSEQLAEIGIRADILLEPARRDSGPAIAAGAIFVAQRDPDAIMLALAADHVVKDTSKFVAACKASSSAAKAGYIVTFGVKPKRPATEYGYISPGTIIEGDIRAVKSFVEKPDLETALKYVEGGYLWNSGNFMFRANVMLREYRTFDMSSIVALTRAVDNASRDSAFSVLEKDSFEGAVRTSIDYAVMEKTTRAAVIPVSLDWSDVGSWRAIWELSDKDADGNAMSGSAVFENSHHCNIWSDKAVVALEGVDNLVVVCTQDAVLVSQQQDQGSLKQLVEKLKNLAPDVTTDHLRVYWPWGTRQDLEAGEGYQIRRLLVKANDGMFVESHDHHTKHWVVVSGRARVILNGAERIIHMNESMHIPINAECRLDNFDEIPLEIIEIQTGS